MRKVILNLALSLDGYIEGPNKEVDWMTFTEETGESLGAYIQEIDTILYGRVSYEAYGFYTPPDDSSEFEKEFYRKTNMMKKVVFSTTRKIFDGNPTVVSSNISQVVKELKQEKGKHIWLYGGSDLITTFVNEDLIDEYRLAIMPIILGAGNPLFKSIRQRVPLNLIRTAGGQSGVVELWYGVNKSMSERANE